MSLEPFKLERYFAQHEFNTQYLLCSSDCESWSINEILSLEAGSDRKLGNLRLGYIESQGQKSLREEISRLYSSISAEHVLVHNGAEEAIFLFMNAALESGDEVIIHTPCYQSLAEIPKSMGCKVISWEAREDRQWKLDLNELEQLITPKTKAIVVNLPHNPTGFLMSRTDWVKLNDFVVRREVLLFCDEVYRESEYAVGDRLPAACDLNEQAVSLGVLSKTYGLAGLRIGWVATRNTKILKRMAELKDYTTICNSAPSEFLAEIALKHREILADRNRTIIKKNLALLGDFFQRHPEVFAWTKPKAGPISFPSLRNSDAEFFCHKAAKKAGVLLLPGSVYGEYPQNFRIGVGRKNFPEALERLDSFMRSLTGAAKFDLIDGI